jgi:5-methyltetrahydrofolate--homocysteine methyltransferase
MPVIQALFDAICKGDRNTVKEVVQNEADNGGDIVAMLNETMIPAMRDIGDRFSKNEVYVPEMLIAARAMQEGLNIIEPLLVDAGHEPIATVCIGTVKGDLHDIGKNLVVMMLKGAGYEVIDLGVDCGIDKFEKAVSEDGAKAVCCSALLTTTMTYMKDVTNHFEGKEISVVIGGAPVSQNYADEIGAQGYADNASDAVKAIESCLGIGA